MAINYKDICKNVFSEKDFIENSLLGIGVFQDGRIIYVNIQLYSSSDILLRIFNK
ncbi:MAG: hypothetical protein KJI71_00675 [Patescibacteria group bacterium]|nr:hypothetical protein [Patescibacteria group bacterium]